MKRLQALMYDFEEAIRAITDEMDEVIASCKIVAKMIAVIKRNEKYKPILS